MADQVWAGHNKYTAARKKLDKQQQVFEDSRFSEKLTICISQKDSTAAANPDELTAFADTFITLANADLPKYIKSIDGKPSDSAMMNMIDYMIEVFHKVLKD